MQTQTDSSGNIARSIDVVGAELEGGLVLLQTKNWTYMDLNETGTAIWRALETPRNLASIVTMLTHEFDIDASRCLGEVHKFVDELASRKFVTVEAER